MKHKTNKNRNTLSRLRKVVASFGGTITDNDSRGVDFSADAPVGHVWADEDLHCLVECSPDRRDRAAVVAQLLERVAGGVKPCEVVDCEWCGDYVEEKTTLAPLDMKSLPGPCDDRRPCDGIDVCRAHLSAEAVKP